MADPDEVQLDKLAKKMLAMPPKKREDSKLGKPRNPSQKQKERAASKGSIGDPTIAALRRTIDRHYAATGGISCHPSESLINEVFRDLPAGDVNCVFLPADGARGPCLAIALKPAFRRYVAFAAEYRMVAQGGDQ